MAKTKEYRKIHLFVLSITLLTAFAARAEEATCRIVKGPQPVWTGLVWKSEIPKDCPFEQSKLFNRIYFTGRHSDYRCGDTFYPSWASDGNLYTPWTDGTTDGIPCRSYPGEKAHTGHAVMTGDDPLNLTIKNTSAPKLASALPYQGRYPAGSLVYNGIWYYGTYCLAPSPGVRHNGFAYNWPILGPMPGFQISFDYGKTWHLPPHTPEDPLFPEPKKMYAPVKIGAPHFVDFGQNMKHSPDGKAYLLAMGADENDPEPRPCIKPGTDGKIYELSECPGGNTIAHANLSWISADQIYLTRVTPSPQTINNEHAYEYFAGHDAKGQPLWTDDFDQIKPLIEWNNHMGCVTATYVPGLQKYLMCITDGWPTSAKMNSYILEADQLTGPWRIVTYMADFGEQAYFLNFPSKFINPDKKTMWLCYSANFWGTTHGVKLKFNPAGGRYGLCLHEVRFLSENEMDPVQEKTEEVNIFAGNIAPQARISVSSTHRDYSPKGITDQVISGYPDNISHEWASDNEKTGAWIRLDWKQNQLVDRIMLFDRPNTLDHILSGLLVFSDGSFIQVSQPLPDSAKEGIEISFKPKSIKWVQFIALKTDSKSLNIGLSEMVVLKKK